MAYHAAAHAILGIVGGGEKGKKSILLRLLLSPFCLKSLSELPRRRPGPSLLYRGICLFFPLRVGYFCHTKTLCLRFAPRAHNVSVCLFALGLSRRAQPSTLYLSISLCISSTLSCRLLS